MVFDTVEGEAVCAGQRWLTVHRFITLAGGFLGRQVGANGLVFVLYAAPPTLTIGRGKPSYPKSSNPNSREQQGDWRTPEARVT